MNWFFKRIMKEMWKNHEKEIDEIGDHINKANNNVQFLKAVNFSRF